MFLGRNSQFAKPLPAADDVVVTGAKPLVGIVVLVPGGVERLSHPFERSGESHQLLVEFRTVSNDVGRILVLCVPLPKIVHQLQKGEKIGRRRDNDFLVVGIGPDGAVVLQSRQTPVR